MKTSVRTTFIILLLAFFELRSAASLFAPYYDTFLEGRANNLSDIYKKSGQASFHLAFALGTNCVPMWGAKYALDDPEVLSQIRLMQEKGGEMIVATGGALGKIRLSIS